MKRISCFKQLVEGLGYLPGVSSRHHKKKPSKTSKLPASCFGLGSHLNLREETRDVRPQWGKKLASMMHQMPWKKSHNYKVGPLRSLEMELWGPYKWPKINGFAWGYNSSYRSYNATYNWQGPTLYPPEV